MKKHAPKTHTSFSPSKKPLSMEVDFERYAPLLEDADITDEQKRELLQALWSIIIGFVDLGFEVVPSSNCGQNIDSAPLTGRSALQSKPHTLIEHFVAANSDGEAA